MFPSFFLFIFDFRIQQIIFKIFEDTLVLDAAEKSFILQNSIGENQTTAGKKGDSLTMKQTTCKIVSEDQLKKQYGKLSKNQPISTLSHV